jgi:hypothetical protein
VKDPVPLTWWWYARHLAMQDCWLSQLL